MFNCNYEYVTHVLLKRVFCTGARGRIGEKWKHLVHRLSEKLTIERIEDLKKMVQEEQEKYK